MGFGAGLLLVLISGAMAGSALAPIKRMRCYRFENYWLIHSLTGTVVMPWALALLTVPHLFDVYRSVPRAQLLLPPLFAFSWGIASTLGGLCVSRIGLSLSYALVIGIGASAGAIVPMLYFSPETLGTAAGRTVLAGVGVMVAGLVLVAQAGRSKERAERMNAIGAAPAGAVMRGSFAVGLTMAVIAGVLSAGLNFSFAFAQEILAAARSAGATQANSTYAVWAIAMLGGMVPNVAYAVYQLRANGSVRTFAASPGTDVPLAVLMGVLFMGSTALYGLGAVRLGSLGTSVGWGIMQIMQIVVGNLNGFLAGEWASAGPTARRRLLTGVTVLVLACCVMAYGNYINERPT